MSSAVQPGIVRRMHGQATMLAVAAGMLLGFYVATNLGWAGTIALALGAGSAVSAWVAYWFSDLARREVDAEVEAILSGGARHRRKERERDWPAVASSWPGWHYHEVSYATGGTGIRRLGHGLYACEDPRCSQVNGRWIRPEEGQWIAPGEVRQIYDEVYEPPEEGVRTGRQVLDLRASGRPRVTGCRCPKHDDW